MEARTIDQIKQSGQPQVHGHGVWASSTPGGYRWIQRSFSTDGLLGQEASVFAEQGPALEGQTAGFGPADLAGTGLTARARTSIGAGHKR